jgi:peptidoglycan-N-acetylglucosamine deacetylase
VKATFCVVGEMVEAFPELVRQIADDGHTLCNHSWDHDFGLGSRSRRAIHEDLERTNAAIHRAAPGTRISYYRQPGGNWTDRVVEVAAELGMSSLHWEVDPQDWSRPGASAIAEVMRAGTDDGAIILLHDGGGERHGTVRALTRVLPELAERHSLDALPPGVDPPRRHGLELPLKPSQR